MMCYSRWLLSPIMLMVSKSLRRIIVNQPLTIVRLLSKFLKVSVVLKHYPNVHNMFFFILDLSFGIVFAAIFRVQRQYTISYISALGEICLQRQYGFVSNLFSRNWSRIFFIQLCTERLLHSSFVSWQRQVLIGFI